MKKGSKHSLETREKMRGRKAWNKGKKASLETRQKMSESLTGRKHSEESIEKMSQSQMGHKGVCHTIETRQQISEKLTGREGTFKGKHHSEESKEKMRIKKLGKKRGIEIRQKLSIAQLGKKKSIEIRKKMRLSALKRIYERFGQTHPNYNPKFIAFFNLINRTFGLIGRYAENGDEFYIRELGFWVDYYESNNNLVIEWNEENHYDINGLTKKKYSLRQFEIEQFLGCLFINVRERDYKENPFMVLSHIKKILGKLVVIKRKIKKW